MFGEGEITKPAADNAPVEGGEVEFSANAVRLTQKNGSLYAICFGQPNSKVYEIKCLKKSPATQDLSIEKIDMLGYSGSIDWQQTEGSLSVSLPDTLPCDYAFVLKIN